MDASSYGDMVSLSTINQEAAMEFMSGNFTVRKTSRVLSFMALDQAHEQNNAAVKSDGGTVGLTQSPEALRRWMVAGPELMRMTSEFEASLERKNNKSQDADQEFLDDFWKTGQITG